MAAGLLSVQGLLWLIALLVALGTRVRLGRLRNLRRPAPDPQGAVLDLDELGGAQVAMPGDDPLLDSPFPQHPIDPSDDTDPSDDADPSGSSSEERWTTAESGDQR